MKDSVFALRSVLNSSPLSALSCCGTLVLGTSLVELAFLPSLTPSLVLLGGVL